MGSDGLSKLIKQNHKEACVHTKYENAVKKCQKSNTI